MPSVIIPAGKSLTVTNKFPDGNINEDIITVGCDGSYNYISYLFFDISTIPCNVSVSYAELVLFKTDKFFDDYNEVFSIYPLLDYFSIYTTYNNRPETSKIFKKDFYPIVSSAAVKINVTAFVLSWVKNGLSATTIALMKKNANLLAKFGSAINESNYLIPFIKVSFEPCICNNQCNHGHTPLPPSIRQVDVTGTVAPESVYEIVINDEVTRSGSKNIDNYYVADEYDNSSNSTPLTVHKTYDIAIIPPIKTGDVEKINLYGSYKGMEIV